MLKVLLKKDFRRLAKDPLSLLFLLALPLVITLIARSVFSPSAAAQFTVPLAVVDQDNTPLSEFITSTLSNEKMASLFEVRNIPLKEAKQELHDNELAGIFVIPKGFTDQFVNQKPAALKLTTNPSRVISTGILQSTFEILTNLLDGIRELFPEQIAVLSQKNTLDMETVFELGRSAMDKILKEKDLLKFPVTFEKEKGRKKESGSPQNGIILAFLPGIAFMSILFVLSAVFKRQSEELENGMINRILVSPATLNQLLSATLLYSLAMVFLIQIVLWLISIPLFHLQIFHGFLLLKGIVYMSLLATLLNAVLYSLPMKLRTIEAFSSIVIITVCLLSGLLVSPLIMPGGLREMVSSSPFYAPVEIITRAFTGGNFPLITSSDAIFTGSILILLFLSLLLFRSKINRHRAGTV
ncbi:MAG: ABC transporter permease [Acidobacteria bacterium]|nr:ABC transporter permease [Acidobacteriota bacterium]